MKVFVTGATGFIAETLIPRLQERGHVVSALVRYVSTRDRSVVEKMLPRVEVHFGDMTDYDSLEEAVNKSHPDAIINLAAQTSVEFSFRHMREVYSVDFGGTVNLSLAAKRCLPDLHRFLQISSVETYGNQPVLPLREDMKLNPAAPYGVAKAAGEYHLNYLHEAFGFPAVIVRNANSYGRKRHKGFVIERIITELLSGKEVVKMGNPDASRDFYHIEDETDFFVKALETDGISGETINSGTGQPISIRDLFARIEGLMNVKAKKIAWKSFSPRQNEIKCLSMDIEKARRLLGWEPRISLDEGLANTIAYWQGETIPA